MDKERKVLFSAESNAEISTEKSVAMLFLKACGIPQVELDGKELEKDTLDKGKIICNGLDN